jgi:hypothetical protein
MQPQRALAAGVVILLIAYGMSRSPGLFDSGNLSPGLPAPYAASEDGLRRPVERPTSRPSSSEPRRATMGSIQGPDWPPGKASVLGGIPRELGDPVDADDEQAWLLRALQAEAVDIGSPVDADDPPAYGAGTSAVTPIDFGGDVHDDSPGMTPTAPATVTDVGPELSADEYSAWPP